MSPTYPSKLLPNSSHAHYITHLTLPPFISSFLHLHESAHFPWSNHTHRILHLPLSLVVPTTMVLLFFTLKLNFYSSSYIVNISSIFFWNSGDSTSNTKLQQWSSLVPRLLLGGESLGARLNSGPTSISFFSLPGLLPCHSHVARNKPYSDTSLP